MAIAYSSQGAGLATTVSATALAPLCPATVNANDILIAHLCYRDTATAFSTPGDWTLLAGPQSAGSTPTGRHWVYGKIAAGTEDGAAVDFGGTGTTIVRHGRIYSFTGYVSGTITDVVVGIAHEAGTSTGVTDVGVTTTVAGAMAVGLIFVTDDNAMVAWTGETGGDWLEPVAEFTTTLGSDGAMQIQTAAMASPGTINGGSQTMAASDPWGVYGFEIRPEPPTAVSIPPKEVHVEQFVSVYYPNQW